ncbi:MAG: hypothetical protein WD845_15390 [Pirellulales bacterium]
MLRFAPRLFCPAFAAFFACISFLGQGLHALVDHPLHEGAAACAHGHAECGHANRSDCCHSDGNSLERVAQQPADEYHGPAIAADASHDPHHCPICGFFAQAQWAVDFQPQWLSTSFSPVAPHAERSLRLVGAGVYQSRAPPLGAAIS